MISAALIGLTIGTLLGLTGAGGSIFAVPLLILLLNLAVQDAMGLALGAVAASAAYGSFLQRKLIFFAPATTLIIGGIIAAPVGKWVAGFTPENILLFGFSGLALLIAIKMYREAAQQPNLSTQTRTLLTTAHDDSDYICKLSPDGQFHLRPRCLSGLIAGGLVVGFASGLFGVGGGFLIVPLLLYLGSIHISRAIATSLLVIFFISGSGFLSYLYIGSDVPINLLAILLISALVGMFLSRPIGTKLAGSTLQKTFSVFLIVVSMTSLAKKLLFSGQLG